MKKVILVTGVAVLALASVAAAYTFSANLTVGSQGADVVALQQALINAGQNIPAGATGYFGSQTKAAVKSFQTAKGLPSTGFVGPLTRGVLNGSAALAPVSSVPAPVGQGTSAPVGITTSGVAGTLAASLWTTPSGVTAYKGQSYQIAGYKIQASASDMSVTSLSFDFDSRFWLYASSITVTDETGAVVGSVSNLNASNFTELTVGSDYRINVPVSNLVVKATQSKYLTLGATFLGVTDRASGTLNVIQAQVRSVDGTGVTDTETVGSARSFSFQGTNVGQLVVTNDPSSPAIQTVQVSTAAQTQNVPLAIYDIKSQNQPGTLQSLTIGLSISSSTLPIGSLFSNVQIKAAGLTYSASLLSATSATFTNLSIPLAADVYTPVSISATLAQDTNNNYDNTYVTTSLNSSVGISAIDATYNTIPTSNVTLTSNAQTFSASGVTASGLAYNPGSVTPNQGASSTEQFTFAYSLTAGNNPIYVSKTYSTAVTATTTTGAGKTNTASVVSNLSFRDSDSTNDGPGYFYIAPGQTKTFTVTNSVSAMPGTVGGTYSITGLNYGTTSYGTGGSLTASTIANALYATLSI